MPPGLSGRPEDAPPTAVLPTPLPRGHLVDRVRCVLAFEQRYLLAQHNTRRPRNRGKWGLLGGRLTSLEDPRVGVRREILEELRVRLPYLVELGDWPHRDEVHRVFGSKVGGAVDWFDPDEILAIEWFSYADVLGLAADGRLHTGFELAAITVFHHRASSRPGSIELSRRPSKHVRGSRKARGARKRTGLGAPL